MTYRPYVADNTMPGLAEVEVQRMTWQQKRKCCVPGGLSRRQLRDLGFDRDAS
ncbi:MAG: hypothetical protein Kilf2KO_18950 [Rhodospirillales bacterium]